MKKIKKNKKGFTLVEIIVVLVILAILAAAAIPTMLGFVEDAKGKTEVANARAAYVAAQTIATQEYAVTGSDDDMDTVISKTKVAQLTGIAEADFDITSVAVTNGKVTEIIYKGKTHTVTITVGKDAVVEPNA